MAKTRLNKNSRYRLERLVTELVVDAKLLKIKEAAEQKFSDELLKLQSVQFPAADMKLLDKYGMAEKTKGFVFAFPPKFKPYTYRIQKEGILHSKDVYNYGTATTAKSAKRRGWITAKLSSNLSKLWGTFVDAKADLESSNATKRADYLELIRKSVTFEQVTAIWEEAKTISSEIVKPTASDSFVISVAEAGRIAADTDSRKATKKVSNATSKPTKGKAK